MAKLLRGITCYNSNALSDALRAQIVAMAPKYLDGCIDADGAYFYDALPASFPLKYFNLTDAPNGGAQIAWALARAATNGIATPESVMLHFAADTVITITGTKDGVPNVTYDYLIPGYGAGTAPTLFAARVPIYYHPVNNDPATFPRVMTNFSTAAIRQVWREYAVEQLLQQAYATGKYARGLWLDNATDVTFNVEAASMSQASRGGRDVWETSVIAGAGTWAASGGAGAYDYKVVPGTALGDGIASPEYAVTVANATTQVVRLSWSSGGNGTYKIYRKPHAASWTIGNWRIATVTAQTYTDTGSAPIAASGGPSRAGEIVEMPGLLFKSAGFNDAKWNAGHGLWIRELKDYLATNPGWLAGRPCKVIANVANSPTVGTSWLTRYANFNGTGAPVADGVFREFQGAPFYFPEITGGITGPMNMYTTFEAARVAGLDVWDTGYNYGISYPSGTATIGGRTFSAFEIMSGIIAQAWLVGGSGYFIQGYANTWEPDKPEWAHMLWPLWSLDLGAPVGPPAILATGTGYTVYGREFANGYVTCRHRNDSNESCLPAKDVAVTLPAGNWLPVTDLNGTTGAQQSGPFQHGNGMAYIWKRGGSAPVDVTPPAAVTLAVGSATPTTLTLSWTAPGDDGVVGQATAYEVRRSLSPITAGNFASATPCSGPPTPAVAGTAQQMVITGLLPGYRWYFALRTSDEAGNWSTVSNSPSAQTTPQGTDVTAPAAVTDLSVGLPGAALPGDFQILRISWTAPGDDLGAGTAATYDVRQSVDPIMSTAPVPLMTNGSLYPTDTAQVTAKFFQDVGSNNPVQIAPLAIATPGSILHCIPPCTPTYAAALSAICGGEYQLTAVGGGNNHWDDIASTVATVPDGAFGAPTGSAVIAGTLASRTFARATVYVNLSTTTAVSGAPGGSLPPFGVQIVQGTGYGTTNTAGMFPQRGGISWAIPTGMTYAQYIAALAFWKTVIINNAQTEYPAGNTLPIVADLRAARASAVASNSTMRIFESHNGLGCFVDGAGAPSVYWPVHQRIHAFCQLDPTKRWILENGVPLKVGTQWYFNITDDRLQEFIADQVTASVARCGADGAFGDEWHTTHPNYGGLHLTVPSPTDWAAGMVRMCQVMNSDFASAAQLSGIPSPAAAGTAQHFDIGHDDGPYEGGSSYYFAMTAIDEAGNTSLLSNVVRYTVPWTDTHVPAAISDLVIASTGPTSIALQWTAPDSSSLTNVNEPVASYDIRYSTASINSGNWSSATPVTGEPTPAAPGTSQAMTVSGLTSGTPYYFAMKSTDAAGNVSALSNVVSGTPTAVSDTTAPSAISNLTCPILLRTTTTLTLHWTATGDDAGTGVASQYDVRLSLDPIDGSNFLSALSISSPPTPAASGVAESMTISGLTADTLYYFAVKAADEAGNWSAISNVVSRFTAALPVDTTPPSAVTDLAVASFDSDSAVLTFKATGDDAMTGTADSYDLRYSTSPITEYSFAGATQIDTSPEPSAPGTTETVIVTGLSEGTLYYVAVRVLDDRKNGSSLSNVPFFKTAFAHRHRKEVYTVYRNRKEVQV